MGQSHLHVFENGQREKLLTLHAGKVCFFICFIILIILWNCTKQVNHLGHLFGWCEVWEWGGLPRTLVTNEKLPEWEYTYIQIVHCTVSTTGSGLEQRPQPGSLVCFFNPRLVPWIYTHKHTYIIYTHSFHENFRETVSIVHRFYLRRPFALQFYRERRF